MHPIRVVFRAFLALAGGSLFVVACSSSPDQAGDSCEPGGDPCPPGTVCAARDGDDICLLQSGQPCDLEEDPHLCVDGSSCLDDGSGAGKCLVGEGGGCSPDADHCAPGLSCEEKSDGSYACFPPVLIKGMVFDAADEAPIAGAQVIAFDDFATAVSDVAISDVAGHYSLAVSVVRNDDGSLAEEAIFTLRGSAQDYQTFPGGVRTALPIQASEAVKGESGYVIDIPLTDIALIALPEEEQGLPSISGSVDGGALATGVLVVAEGGAEGEVAISDRAGKFTIFNVPPGSYEVRGYAAGLQLTPEAVEVAAADVTGVVLGAADEALGSINGSVNIVNPEGASATSVVLVVESTFSDTFVKGEVPRGLRAPLAGPPTISGAFTIEDVPAGRYVVLASFENDDLVRDPDTNIAGTQIVTVEMASPGEAVELESSFKITGALEVVAPGAEAAEGVSGTPTFEWGDDSSEEYYSVVVYDSFGDLVWEDTDVDSVSGGGTVTLEYGGPALEVGMYYQFRATSWRSPGGNPSPISTTEDLRGVFFITGP